MYFKVKIVAADGVIRHEIRQGNADEIRQQLLNTGNTVLSLRPDWTRWSLAPRVDTGEWPLVFCDQLHTLLKAGISVPESLLALRDSERTLHFRRVLAQVLSGIETGQSLSSALAAHPAIFSGILVSMLKAAEKTGALSDALARFTRFRRQIDQFRGQLWAAATYPLMLLGAGSAVVLFLMLYVVPRFSLVYRDLHGPLPWSARLLLAWGELVSGKAVAVLILLAVAVLGCVLILRQPAVRQRAADQFLRLPRLGSTLREVQLAHYFHSLGLLLTAGIPLPQALTLSQDLLSPALRHAALQVGTLVNQGERLSLALERQQLVTPVALRLIQAGERSGSLGEMLVQAAEFHDRQVLRAAAMFSGIIGPLLMAVMGLLIGGIVVLLYMPIFQLADGLG